MSLSRVFLADVPQHGQAVVFWKLTGALPDHRAEVAVVTDAQMWYREGEDRTHFLHETDATGSRVSFNIEGVNLQVWAD